MLIAAFANLVLVLACSQANVAYGIVEHGHRDAQLRESWSAITESLPESASFAYSTFNLLWESMRPTVEFASDTLPAGRTKAVHSAGVVAKVKFNSISSHPYSGLFKGADSALIRFSLATQPSAHSSLIVPAVAVKWFRDNSSSANTFFMGGLAPQDSLNFFARNLSTHISAKEGGTGARIVARKFATVSKWPVFVGVSQVSQLEQDGRVVQNPIYPFQLVIQPTEEAVNILSKTLPTLDDADPYISLKALQSLPPHTPLWKVWAAPSPRNLKFTQIGVIVSDSMVVSNAYGNDGLFFQHQIFEQDVLSGSYGESWGHDCPDMFSCDSCAAIGNNNCEFIDQIFDELDFVIQD